MPPEADDEITPEQLDDQQAQLQRTGRLLQTILALLPSFLPLLLLSLFGVVLDVPLPSLLNILQYSCATIGLLLCVNCCIRFASFWTDFDKTYRDLRPERSALTQQFFDTARLYYSNWLKANILSTAISTLVWAGVQAAVLQKLAGKPPFCPELVIWLLAFYNVGIAIFKQWHTTGASPPVLVQRIYREAINPEAQSRMNKSPRRRAADERQEV